MLSLIKCVSKPFDVLAIVPGLSDNVALGVRRGRLLMTGDEVKEIFEPVVQVIHSLCERHPNIDIQYRKSLL